MKTIVFGKARGKRSHLVKFFLSLSKNKNTHRGGHGVGQGDDCVFPSLPPSFPG